MIWSPVYYITILLLAATEFPLRNLRLLKATTTILINNISQSLLDVMFQVLCNPLQHRSYVAFMLKGVSILPHIIYLVFIPLRTVNH